jgi:adenine specific DNA methylase Mod
MASDHHDSDDDFDLEDVPFSFDQEIEILCRMNEQQMETIDELQKKLDASEKDKEFLIESVKMLEKRIDVLQKELIEAVQNKPATCFVACEHCRDDKDSEAIAVSIANVVQMMTPPKKQEVVEEKKEEAVEEKKEEVKPVSTSSPFGFAF